MRRRDYYWSLYHTSEKNQLDNLRTDQVEAVFAAVPSVQRPEWWVWREGFDNWKPFEDFPALLVSLRQLHVPQYEEPPSPPQTTTSEWKPPRQVLDLDDQKTVELSLASAYDEDRENMRFKKTLEVVIYDGDKSFKAETVNISLKGMSLKEPLPAGLPQYFNVEVRKKGKVIPLLCSVIPNADGSRPNRMHIESNEYSNALLSLLLSTT